jgi:hypothetical protein
MPSASDRPSIMDSPSAQRAALAVGAVFAAGAALFFARRARPDQEATDAYVSDAPPWTTRTSPREARAR